MGPKHHSLLFFFLLHLTISHINSLHFNSPTAKASAELNQNKNPDPEKVIFQRRTILKENIIQEISDG